MTIRDLRTAKGLTQVDVARELGIDQANISAYENGKWMPKYSTAKKLAEIYGCSVEQIMDGCTKEVTS